MGYIERNYQKKTFKSDFTSSFVQEGVEITGSKIIAYKFNKLFTEIGPDQSMLPTKFHLFLTLPPTTQPHLISPAQIPMTSRKLYEITGLNRARVMTIFQQNC